MKANAQALALALPIAAVFDSWGPFLIGAAFASGLALFIYALRLPNSRPVPVRQAHPAARGGTRWGLFLGVPILPFLSVGLFRPWRRR